MLKVIAFAICLLASAPIEARADWLLTVFNKDTREEKRYRPVPDQRFEIPALAGWRCLVEPEEVAKKDNTTLLFRKLACFIGKAYVMAVSAPKTDTEASLTIGDGKTSEWLLVLSHDKRR